MIELLAALNPLRSVDIVFFVVIAAIIVLVVAVYFLIPVINRKQYKEMRENLNKREVAFNAGKQVETVDTADETEPTLDTKEE